jgi:predicted ATPase/DNA-binding CsgD family transcriptional regulator
MPDTPKPAPKDSTAEPGRVVEFPGTFSLGPTPANNLPLRLSGLVGHEREISQVGQLLANNRLLTLTGPGGSGKTRLALAVADEVLEGYEDGVWLVELAPLSEPELVPQALVSVLGAREAPGSTLTETLAGHLETKALLLILDNCEHLVGACASLTEALLGRCPGLSVLATSREALGVEGEILFVVPQLSLPDPRRITAADSLSEYEAARLFVERARAVRPDFALTEQNTMAVAQVCHHLDGMPLAIELAAARARVLSAGQIAERLDDSFALLKGGGKTTVTHHGTLRATMDWSHELLLEEEKVLFGRLSVFAGGFTLEAAEAVGAGGGIEEEDVLDVLSSLVDKSLVLVAEQDGQTRYHLLETVRQYGREKLLESGATEAIRGRHAGFFLALAEKAEPKLKSAQSRMWLERLETEHDNLRAALVWLLGQGELDKAARLGWALWLFWWIRAHFAEGRRSMERVLSGEGGASMTASARAKALYVVGAMANGQGDLRSARARSAESLRLFRELDDRLGTAYALGNVAFSANAEGQHQRAITLIEEALDLFLEEQEKWGAAMLHGFLAAAWRNQGDQQRAKRRAERGLALSREVGERQTISVALYTLATLTQVEGDHERASDLFEEALNLSAELGNGADVAQCLEGLASIAAAKGLMERAARLWGIEEALLEKIEGASYTYVPDRSLHWSRVAAARNHLGQAAWADAWAEGKAMRLELALEYALDRPQMPATTDLEAYPAGLSAREAEVLSLVAEGLTNPRIAERLYLSPRTVGQHLRSVYRKLGVSSRAAAARVALERGLI